MPADVLAWLLAQLGTATDQQDLANRYLRLGTAKAVAAEVLAERRAALLGDPLRLTVDGVVTLDQTGNLAGVERQIAALAALTAPDDPTDTDTSVPDLSTAPLVSTRWCR